MYWRGRFRVQESFEDMQVVTNTGATPLQVWFEPWGIQHPLKPGESFRVEGRSAEAGQLEVVEADSTIAVYGWPGSTLRVYSRETLVDDIDIVLPELPPGMSPRSFVEFMFGGPGGPGKSSNNALRRRPRKTHWWRFWK
jgi:hypothetical protein